MNQLAKQKLLTLLRLPVGHKLQVSAVMYAESCDMSDVDLVFEVNLAKKNIIEKFNGMLSELDEAKKKECTISPSDTPSTIRKKCRKASQWGVYYPAIWGLYGADKTDDSGTDVGSDAGGDAGDAGGLEEEKSSTERVRRFYRRHPEKVKKYLRKTTKDRVARNRDRREAIKKHGKAKMKNHDVHHPNGPNGGSWRLAKKDHGRDKKNESYIMEGGAAGHMAHPYEDESLAFTDIKDMIERGLVGDLNAEEKATEKLDGQNVMFTVKDGRVFFARNKGQVKNKGKNALDVAGIRQMFAGRGNIEKAFTSAAEDVQSAIDALPQEKRTQMFADGSKFMNVEIIFPDTQNVIPYDKSVLVFHGSVEYDADGNEIKRSVSDGKELSDELTKVNAQKQKTFGISGPKTISFSDAGTVENKTALKKFGRQIAALQSKYNLTDKSTIEDYKLTWWSEAIDTLAARDSVELSREEREGLIRRWALGDKSFKVTAISNPETKKWVKEFEANELKSVQREATSPLERIFLNVGALSLRRVTDFLSANNPRLAKQLKQEVAKTIKDIQQTGDADKLAKLQIQLERLQSIGMDKIVPTEGIVFIYKGKPYKFTGTFAPINQILGTLKFDKGKAELTEPTDSASQAEKQPAEKPKEPARTVAIFTGRFQPFHSGHYSIYKSMVDQFGKDNVYIATSNKTEAGKSPFDFSDKKQIMTQMFDVPEDKVVQVKNPYAPAEVLEKLPPETVYVTAVSQKDSERLGGKYFEPFTAKGEKKGYADKGYYTIAPELKLDVNGKNISGTQLRSIFGNPNITDEVKQEIFAKVYGKFDQDIFDKIVKTTTKSEEELKITKKYADDKEKMKAAKAQNQKKKKEPKNVERDAEALYYKPGQTWQTSGGNWGGKNRNNVIKYFGTQDKAKLFATK